MTQARKPKRRSVWVPGNRCGDCGADLSQHPTSASAHICSSRPVGPWSGDSILLLLQECRDDKFAFSVDRVKLAAKLNAADVHPAAGEPALFEQHTRAVADFLNELYAIMVDPCAEGSITVDAMKKALIDAAIRDRDRAEADAALRSRIERLEGALRWLLENQPGTVWCNGPDDSWGVNCEACGVRTSKAEEVLTHKADCQFAIALELAGLAVLKEARAALGREGTP
jgi:hypothetical protein